MTWPLAATIIGVSVAIIEGIIRMVSPTSRCQDRHSEFAEAILVKRDTMQKEVQKELAMLRDGKEANRVAIELIKNDISHLSSDMETVKESLSSIIKDLGSMRVDIMRAITGHARGDNGGSRE